MPRILKRPAPLRSLCILLCSVFAGCAQAPPLTGETLELYGAALDRWLARDRTLQTIHQRIQRASLPLCGERTVPVLGLVVQLPRNLPDSLQRVARQRFGRDAAPTVTHVIPASAAADAGVRNGDRVVRLGTRRIRSVRALYTPRRTSRETLELRVLRDGRPLDLALENRPGCPSRVTLADSAGLNAHATTDGQIVFFNGLMRFLDREASIAFVLGHEIAHNLVYNRRGRRKITIEDEFEADRAGAHLAIAAGFELTPNDFRFASVAVARPWQLRERPTHPTAPERAVLFRQTLDEIAAKRARRAPMLQGVLTP